MFCYESEPQKCERCGGSGEIVLADKCPQECITADIRAFIKLADWAENHHMPIGGGVLDQTESFLYGLELWQRQLGKWKRQ